MSVRALIGRLRTEFFTTATNPALNAGVSQTIVDTYTGIVITLSTTGNNQTLQSPSYTTGAKIFTVVNNDTSNNNVPVIANSVTFTLTPGEAQSFVWDGSAWGPTDLGITAIPVVVAQGGSGRTTGTSAYALIATGTTATGAQQSLAVGATTEILVGGGASALPVWTTATGSGAPVRATSPSIAAPTLTGTTTMGDAAVQAWDVAPASDGGFSGQQESVTAGATVALRDVLYEGADGEWYLADADASATMPAMRMAVGAGTDGNAVNTITKGVVRNDSWTWTPGLPIYVSTTGTTGNTLTQTAPSGDLDCIQIVGYALTSTVMYFDPSPNIVEIHVSIADTTLSGTPKVFTVYDDDGITPYYFKAYPTKV